ncbi:MAG: hypothetical protein DBX55_00210 [Verrucomicrobia bacterium]|nr:MAG: hypothetical protein DBX55_00210 [Verrucomicrobiota bacterium]
MYIKKILKSKKRLKAKTGFVKRNAIFYGNFARAAKGLCAEGESGRKRRTLSTFGREFHRARQMAAGLFK